MMIQKIKKQDLAQEIILKQIAESIRVFLDDLSIHSLVNILRYHNNKPFGIMLKDIKEVNKRFGLNLSNKEVRFLYKQIKK